MKKFIASCVIGGALILGSVGGAFAADNQTRPGTPGDANCVGQTNAFLAQAAKNGLIDDAFHGIGGVGRAFGLSTQQVEAVVQAFCNGQ